MAPSKTPSPVPAMHLRQSTASSVYERLPASTKLSNT